MLHDRLSPYVLGFRSSCCNRLYERGKVGFSCPVHGSDAGTLDVAYDYERLANDIDRAALKDPSRLGMWRYLPLLPVHPDAAVPPLQVGDTPLYSNAGLAAKLGLSALWIKDEARQPTGSLKDRASALAVALAEDQRAEIITTASTGNAAVALAGLCAGSTLTPVIFVPAAVKPAKLCQLLAYGAHVVLVDGSYDDAFTLCMEASHAFGWYLRSTGINPFMTEGKKTVVYELVEALDWSVPDVIMVSAGDGCILGALGKGLQDLMTLGWIERLPRLIGVQAAGSDYLYQAWGLNSVDLRSPIKAHTIADSLCAGVPRDRWKAMAAVRGSNGAFVRVDDEGILRAIYELANATGVFAEPAGAAPLAGLHIALECGLIQRGESVALIVTGNGLKDIQAVNQGIHSATGNVIRCAPDLAALRNLPVSITSRVSKTEPVPGSRTGS